MEEQRPQLTQRDIANAEARRDFVHPLISVIDNQLPEITRLNGQFTQVVDSQEQQAFIKENFGFLANGFANAGEFTLGPEDIISIWSKFARVLPPDENNYHGRSMANIISASYIIQGLENPAWKTFPDQFLRTDDFPPGLTPDEGELEHLRTRFEDIGNSRDSIYIYLYGSLEKGRSYHRDLIIRSQTDQASRLEEEQYRRFIESRSDPLLESIIDSFANPLQNIGFLLEHA
jgi:hypothetical protein